MSGENTNNTYTNVSDLPTMSEITSPAYVPVEDTNKDGKKVDLNRFAEKDDLNDKADKVTDATVGNLAKLDENGNLLDSGIHYGNVVTSKGYKKVNLGTISTVNQTVTIPVHEREAVLAKINESSQSPKIDKCIIQCDPDVTDATITFKDVTARGVEHTPDWLSVQTTSGAKFPIIIRELAVESEFASYEGVIHSEVDGSGIIRMPTDWDDNKLGGYNIYVPENQEVVINSHPIRTANWCFIKIQFPFAIFYLYGNHSAGSSEYQENLNPELLWN